MSADFEPVRVGRPPRRLDPLAIGAVVVAMALLLAVAKPWEVPPEAGPITGPSGAPPIVAAGPIGSGSLATPPADVLEIPGDPAPAWRSVAAIARSHDAWGVQAVVVDPPTRESPGIAARTSERWRVLQQQPGDGPVPVALDTAGRRVRALGITAPLDETPLALRIWRYHTLSPPDWVDAQPLASSPARAGLLLAPPVIEGERLDAWAPGEYRIDMLTARGVVRVIAMLPDSTGRFPASAPGPVAHDLVPAAGVDLAGIRATVAFATVDGKAIALDGIPGEAFDEATAWFATGFEGGLAKRGRTSSAHLPRATGLGVRLPDGSDVTGASIRAVSWGTTVEGATRLVDNRRAPAEPPRVLFAAPGEGAWSPGVYALDASWRDPTGAHTATWTIELRPSPSDAPPLLLRVARIWTRFSGRVGFAVGTVPPVSGGPSSAFTRFLPPALDVAGGDATDLEDWVDRCQGARLAGPLEAFGVLSDSDTGPPRVIARLAIDDPSAIPIVTAPSVLPGLSVVAPVDAETLPTAAYNVAFERDGRTQVLTACLGNTVEASGTAP